MKQIYVDAFVSYKTKYIENDTYQVIKHIRDPWRGAYDEYVVFVGTKIECSDFLDRRDKLSNFYI